MNKKICSAIICSAFFMNLSAVQAFEHRSENAGFSVSVPDNAVSIVNNNAFAVSSTEAGTHSISATSKEAIKEYTKNNFSTEIFKNDLQNMALDIKAGKDILTEENYVYIKTPQNKLQQYVQNSFPGISDNMLGKRKYKITKINGIPALEINNEVIVNYTTELPTAYTLKEQKEIQKYDPKIKFSIDGKQASTKYTLVATNYILSVNDNLYTISSSYFDSTSNLSLPVPEKGSWHDAVMTEFFAKQFNEKAYKKSAKNFIKKVTFFEPNNEKNNLIIKDEILGKEFAIPNDWWYLQTTKQVETTPMNLMFAWPEQVLDKLAIAYLNSNSLEITPTETGIDIKSNISSSYDTNDILNAYTESIFSISAKYDTKSTTGKNLKDLLDSPELTKIFIISLFDKSIFTQKELSELEKFIQLKTLSKQVDVNNKNALIDLNYELLLHIPKDFSKTNELLKNDFDKNSMFDFSLIGKNKFYFDANGKINILGYYANSKTTKNSFIEKEYLNFNLYQ